MVLVDSVSCLAKTIDFHSAYFLFSHSIKCMRYAYPFLLTHEVQPTNAIVAIIPIDIAVLWHHGNSAKANVLTSETRHAGCSDRHVTVIRSRKTYG